MKTSLVTLLCLIAPVVIAAPKVVQIGALFHGPDSQQELVFRYAVDMVNANRSLHLVDLSERVKEHDNLEVSKTMCEMMSKGIWAIFGPQSSSTSDVIQSICDTVEVPHIETRMDANQQRQDVLVNLYPHPNAFGKVFVDLVHAWDWKSFTIVYEDNNGLTRISPLLKKYNRKGYTLVVRKLNEGSDYRMLLRSLKHSGETHFVLDCSYEKLPDILMQAMQVGLLVEENSFIITQLDLHIVDLEAFQHGGANITGVRLLDPDDPFVQITVNDWAMLNKRGRSISINPNEIQAESALMYDAVQLFARTVPRMWGITANASSLNCEDGDNWGHGHSLVNLMKDSQSSFKGLTGPIIFDNEGFRTNFLLDVVELTVNGLVKVGIWNSTEGLNLMRTQSQAENHIEEGIANKTLVVLTAISEPYGMRKDLPEQLSGNERYEGFGIEVIHEISRILGFNYTIDLQLDNAYGSLNNDTKEWNGIIREIQDFRADLGITDLTITAERQTGADFTLPFMNLGISILYKKPTKAPPSFFSFMDPFSIAVWIVMLFGYVGVSLMLFVMGRICPYEWTNPYPCIEEPETLENQFSLKNSLWFTIGSLMQQGTEIAPIAVSTRMVAGIWWFFTLIMVSSYTANLAAFLTVENMSPPFKIAEDLVDQTLIKYGAKRGGSTLNFFRDSDNVIFQRMYTSMMETPGVLTKTNEEGLEKVKTENYAYFMESTSIEYMVERNCEVQQYGGLLDNKGYGIAMRKNYKYRNVLNGAVLKLQESGLLMKLKNRWWKEERGGGQCQGNSAPPGNSGLKLQNMGGVFVVLVGGIGIAVFLAFFELIWEVCHIAHREKVPFRTELVEELKFIAKLHGSTKPVRKYNEEETVEEDIALNPYPYGFVVGSKEPLT